MKNKTLTAILKNLDTYYLDPSKGKYYGPFILYSLCVLIMFCLIVLDIVKNKNWNFMLLLESLLILIHIYSRIATVFLNSKLLTEILLNIEMFWSYEDTKNEFLILSSVKLFEFIHKCFKFSRYLTIFAQSVAFTLPFITERPYPIHVFNPKGFMYWVILIIENMFIWLGTNVVFGVDILMYLLLMLVANQLDILNNYILSFDYHLSDSKSRFRRIVQYHIFLTDYTTKLNIFLSKIMFIHFSLAGAVLCFEVYSFKINPHFDNSVVPFFYIIICLFESLYLFCNPAEKVLNKGYEVSGTIYSTSWYTHDALKFRDDIVLILARGNRPLRMTAAGYFDVRLTSFAKIFKTVLSFYSFLNAQI